MSILDAAKHGYSQRVQEILQSDRTCVHHIDQDGLSALHWAALRGNDTICTLLLDATAQADKCDFKGCTVLHAAVRGGHTPCVQLLLSRGATVNVQDNSGCTPLHVACQLGYSDIAKHLLERGADVFLRNSDGRDPVSEAATYGHSGTCATLQNYTTSMRNPQAREAKTLNQPPIFPSHTWQNRSTSSNNPKPNLLPCNCDKTIQDLHARLLKERATNDELSEKLQTKEKDIAKLTQRIKNLTEQLNLYKQMKTGQQFTASKTYVEELCLTRDWADYKHPELIQVVSPKDSEWYHSVDYKLLDCEPLNRKKDDVPEGACSLIFRIRHNDHNLILKMLGNVLPMQEFGHNMGFSYQNAINYRYSPECFPYYLPPHPNIIHILHHYIGATDEFRKFKNLFIPTNDTEFTTRTLFVVLPQYPTTLRKYLADLVEAEMLVLENFILQLLYQLLNAVDFLLSHHIVHRDIKTDNIFLNGSLQPVIADFGFALKLRDGDAALYAKSTDHIQCGNPMAWAPELIRWEKGVEKISLETVTLEEIYARCDSYAVGKMFYLSLMSQTQEFPDVSQHRPHYNRHDLPALPFSPRFNSLLQRMVLDLPSERLTARQAMLRAGTLLYSESLGGVTCRAAAADYIQNRMTSLKSSSSSPCVSDHSIYGESVCRINESIEINRTPIEKHFLSTITAEELFNFIEEDRIGANTAVESTSS
ncbi:hypothetical protein Ahia01_000843700 [Argonauta hians]